MALGSVSSLGVGSGFELQSMLDKLKAVDQVPIDNMESKKSDVEAQLAEYDVVNTKLLTMKSHALSLSLQSNFLSRQTTVSDEDIIGAEAIEGASISSNSIEVNRLATKSSWRTAAVASTDTPVYIPTVQQSAEGFDTTDQDVVTTSADTLTITYGPEGAAQTINVDLSAGMTLDNIVAAINGDPQNQIGGSTYVTASTYADDEGAYHLQIASTAAGSGDANRVMITQAPEALTMAAPDASFSYSLGGEDNPVVLAVKADTTFAELAEQINADSNNIGVTAKVIDDGTADTPYRLILTANDTGEDNRIFINGLQMEEVQGADGASLNASLSVDGIAYNRQSNTGISDIIQGVTLELKKEGESTLSVTSNTEDLKADIMGLVESYNDTVQEIKTKSAYDEDAGKFGVLGSSLTVKGLSSELNSIMSSIIDISGNSSVKSMVDMGMSIDRSGVISIDEATLDNVLSNNLNDVMGFFTGDEDLGVVGFADVINDNLRDITRTSGVMDTAKDAANTQIDRLDTDIEASTERLNRRYDIMANQFVQLDVVVNQMNSESSYLQNVFDSFNSTFSSSNT